MYCKYFPTSKIVTVLCLLFAMCLSVIVSRYMKYKTVTNVKTALEKSEISTVSAYLYVPTKSIGGNTNSSRIEVKMNDRSVRFGNSFVLGTYTAVHLQWNDSNSQIEQEYFELISKIDLSNLAGIMKVVNNLHDPERSHICLSTKDRNNLKSFNQISIAELLTPPYDTKCSEIRIPKYSCRKHCMVEAELTGLPGCLDRCNTQACTQLHVSSVIGYVRYLKQSVVFHESVLIIESAAQFNSMLLIQQIIGLVTMFFEFSVLDIGSVTGIITNNLHRVKSILIKKFLGELRIVLKAFLLLAVLSGFLYHIHFSVTSYLRYETGSEAFFGIANLFESPNFRVCRIKPSASNFSISAAYFGGPPSYWQRKPIFDPCLGFKRKGKRFVAQSDIIRVRIDPNIRIKIQ